MCRKVSCFEHCKAISKRMRAVFLCCVACCIVVLAASCHRHAHESVVGGSDGKHHFYICKQCGEKTGSEAHSFDLRTGNCSVCGYHRHERAVGGSDEAHHLYVCRLCGEEMGSEVHSFDSNTGNCSVCGYHRHEKVAVSYNDEHHFYVCKQCGEEMGSELHSLDLKTGDCFVCGYHRHVSEIDDNKSDSERHYYRCSLCLKKIGSQAHDFEQSGNCKTCGFHKHIISIDKSKSDGRHHYYYCASCSELVGKGSHSYFVNDVGHIICRQEACCYDGTGFFLYRDRRSKFLKIVFLTLALASALMLLLMNSHRLMSLIFCVLFLAGFAVAFVFDDHKELADLKNNSESHQKTDMRRDNSKSNGFDGQDDYIAGDADGVNIIRTL